MTHSALWLVLVMVAVLLTVGEPAVADWRQEADRRIEKHRKGDFELAVVGAGGEPIDAAELEIEQVESAFRFGMAINGKPWDDSDPNEVKYRQFILKHFNTLVCENHMKWYATEKKRDEHTYERADRYMRWAEEHGLAMRGHCLFWSKPKFVQDWVKELPDDELRAEAAEHLESIVPRYRGRLIAWDVNNEMLDGSFYKDRLGEDIRAWMFRKAHELDPNTPMFVNEYGMLGSDRKTDRYIELIQSLRDQGAPIGGIGIQEHAADHFVTVEDPNDDLEPERAGAWVLIPEEVWARLDRLGELGLPIHLTEISSKTSDPVKRAETLEALFRVGYAHPKVEAILLWGFWAKRHWLGGKAALVGPDWEVLPAGERISKLLLEEWRTRTTAETDDNGVARFRGFHGTYEVRLPGREPGRVELTRERPKAELTIGG